MSDPIKTVLLTILIAGWLPAIDKGTRYYLEQDFANARSYYEAVLREAPDSAPALLGLGSSAFQQEDLETARQAFEDALGTDDPEIKAKALYNMGNVLYQDQRYDESLVFYRKALELDPNDLDTKYNYEFLRRQLEQQKQQQQQKGDDQKQRDQKQQDDQEQAQQNQDKQNQQEQDQQQQQDQAKQDQQQQDPNADEHQEQQDEQEQQEQQTRQQADEAEDSADKQSARAVLDALKDDEKIYMKKQMARAQSKKLEKDW
ncbi:MAG: tetratricopeptide repeat protein [Candidatus Neomarinimicrobiota bacterium]